MGVGALRSLSIEHLPTEVDLGCLMCGYDQESNSRGFSVVQRLISMLYSEFTTLCLIHGSYSSCLYNDIRLHCG